MAESEKVARARQNMTDAMMRLERDWSREMRFTCIARHPSNPECYMVVTSDPDLKAVAEAMIRSEQAPIVVPPDEGAVNGEGDRTMRWDCGEELAEKKARLEEWHRSFAWWPRKVAPHDCRWMEWVERRGTCFAAMHGPLWSFEYRAPSTP